MAGGFAAERRVGAVLQAPAVDGGGSTQAC